MSALPLPIELVIRVISHLDSYSIFCLSQLKAYTQLLENQVIIIDIDITSSIHDNCALRYQHIPPINERYFSNSKLFIRDYIVDSGDKSSIKQYFTAPVSISGNVRKCYSYGNDLDVFLNSFKVIIVRLRTLSSLAIKLKKFKLCPKSLIFSKGFPLKKIMKNINVDSWKHIEFIENIPANTFVDFLSYIPSNLRGQYHALELGSAFYSMFSAPMDISLKLQNGELIVGLLSKRYSMTTLDNTLHCWWRQGISVHILIPRDREFNRLASGLEKTFEMFQTMDWVYHLVDYKRHRLLKFTCSSKTETATQSEKRLKTMIRMEEKKLRKVLEELTYDDYRMEFLLEIMGRIGSSSTKKVPPEVFGILSSRCMITLSQIYFWIALTLDKIINSIPNRNRAIIKAVRFEMYGEEGQGMRCGRDNQLRTFNEYDNFVKNKLNSSGSLPVPFEFNSKGRKRS
ncbi:hypothetical protein WICMUC_001653 [Wickerhamomyces mucosus]|uniref:Uncharacterized protein n=1 Tax=Wickerhamomyces mucosus TaxID=1378264 RepID=A0A9P8PVW1_9ASCO|nr:hypothetical protein WICMUC_001653 [Wickerhamomyces mucosus]